MAPTLLDSGTGLTTNSKTFAKNRRYTVAVMTYNLFGEDTIGLSGSGLTLTQQEFVALDDPGGPTYQALAVFVAEGSGETGQLTITSGQGATGTAVAWFVVATDWASRPIQDGENSGTGTALSVALAAFANERSGVLSFFAVNNHAVSATTLTPGEGFAQLGTTLALSNTWRFFAQYRLNPATSVVATQTGNFAWVGIALEVSNLGDPQPQHGGFYLSSHTNARSEWEKRRQIVTARRRVQPRFRPRI